MKRLTIAEDKAGTWEEFTREAGFVPDPMIVRAADMFLLGRSAVEHNVEKTWTALEKNVFGILAFFDALVTRECIPFINYWQTFTLIAVEDMLRELAIQVDVRDAVYSRLREGALEQLGELQVENLPVSEVEKIEAELGAFAYDWQPDLGELPIPDTHVQAAQFLLGGLIFGSYASESATDHLIQGRRSELFLALTAPRDRHQAWVARKEQELFDGLRQACVTSEHVRAEEYPAAPSVVPYLMSKEPRPRNPSELLTQALDFREERGGESYRRWFSALREAWSWGDTRREAMTEVERVRQELEKHYNVEGSKPSQARCDFTFDVKPGGIGAGTTLKDVPIQLPAWVRRWFPENVYLKPHGKILLRLGMAQRQYEDLVFGLKRLWNAA
jgi:hypothetical protein